MTWPVRSRQLLAEVVAAPGANTKRWSAAVPAGKTWLYKEFRFFNSHSVAMDFFVFAEVGGTVWVLSKDTAVPAGTARAGVGGGVVLPEGYRLGYQVSVNGPIQVYFSGAVLG